MRPVTTFVFVFLFGAGSGSVSAQQGVFPDRIVIGQSAAFTGPPAAIVKELTAGAQAYFDRVNAQGGVRGRKLVLESLDDALDAKRTAENTRRLVLEKKVFCLFLYRGTPQVEAVLPFLDEFKIPLVGPSTGAQSMFSPPKRYLFPVRTSYHTETEVIVDHLVSTGVTKIAMIRDDSSFGQDGFSGFEGAMKKHGIGPHAVAIVPRGATQADDAVTKLSAAQPQAVLIVAQPNNAAAFIKKMKAARPDVLLYALSNLSSDSFIKDLGTMGYGVVVSQVTPSPTTYDAPVSRELQGIIKSNSQVPLSYSTLEGFISAKVLVEGLRRTGPRPTREKFVAALEGLQRFDLGGVVVSYGPQARTGSQYVELTIIGRQGKFIR